MAFQVLTPVQLPPAPEDELDDELELEDELLELELEDELLELELEELDDELEEPVQLPLASQALVQYKPLPGS